MTPEEQALAGIIVLLRRLNIAFMVTGSVATSYHGRPRSTHDPDVVIDPTAPQLDELVASIDAAGYYVDRDGAARAWRARRQFNVIEGRVDRVSGRRHCLEARMGARGGRFGSATG